MDDDILNALPVQLLEVPEGTIVKRGVAEVLVPPSSAVALAAALSFAGKPGGASIGELLAIVRRTAPDVDATQFLDDLRRNHLLVPSQETGSLQETPADILAWSVGSSPNAVSASFAAISFEVLGVNAVSRRLVESLFLAGARPRTIDHPEFRNVRMFDREGRLIPQLWGLPNPEAFDDWSNAAPPETQSCLIACSDFGGLQRLAEWNAFAYRQKRHFLPVVLQNAIGLVGPLTIPGETCCFECMLLREEALSPVATLRRAVET